MSETNLILDALRAVREDIRELRRDLSAAAEAHEVQDAAEHKALQAQISEGEKKWSKIVGVATGAAVASGGIGATLAKLLGAL